MMLSTSSTVPYPSNILLWLATTGLLFAGSGCDLLDGSSSSAPEDETPTPTTSRILEAELPSRATIELEIDARTAQMLDYRADAISIDFLPLGTLPAPAFAIHEDLGGALISLTPDGMQFPNPLPMQITVPEERVPDTTGSLQVLQWEPKGGYWKPVPVRRNLEQPGAITALLEHFSIYDLAWSSLADPQVVVETPFVPDLSGKLRFEGFDVGVGFDVSISKGLDGNVVTQSHFDGDSAEWEPALEEGYYTLRVQHEGSLVWEQRLVVGLAEDPLSYDELIRQYAPVFSFHPDEQYLPVALDQSYFNTDVLITSPYNWEVVKGEEAMDFMARRGHVSATLQSDFMFDNWTVRTSDLENGTDPIVVYASVHHSLDRSMLYVTYWTFYVHDPKTPSTAVAAHNRDRESFTIVFDSSDAELEPRPIAAVFGAHESSSYMRPKDDAEREWNGDALLLGWDTVSRVCDHPQVYVAGGSHALYPREGEYQVSIVDPWYDLTWTDETAGGRAFCPSDVTDELCFSSSRYELDTLPTSSTLDDSAPWRHLLFSGYWVDGLHNYRFPPFVDRYYEVDIWTKGADSIKDPADNTVICEGEDELTPTPAPASAFSPAVPDATVLGWQAGDGHVHTGRSDRDGAYLIPSTIEHTIRAASGDLPTAVEMALAANDLGLQWLMLTDHEDMLDEDTWQTQREEDIPDSRAALELLPVSEHFLHFVNNGEEAGTSLIPVPYAPSNQGHFLSYGLTELVPWLEAETDDVISGSGDYMLAEDLFSAVYDDQGGLGALAHPFSTLFPWDDWEAWLVWGTHSPIGIEVVNGASDGPSVNYQALASYHAALKTGLNVYPVGNSDAHWPDALGTAYTYLYLGGKTPTDEEILYAFAHRHTVASNGLFLEMTASTDSARAIPGDTLALSSGEEYLLSFEYEVSPGDELLSVSIYTGESALDSENDMPAQTLHYDNLWTSPTTSRSETSSTFVWALGLTAAGRYAVTSPILLDVIDAPFCGAGIDTALIVDSSGSMGENDPNNYRKQSAQAYIDLAQGQDQIAVVDFDDDARVAAWLQKAADNREALHRAVDTIDSNGGTNLGAGLEAGFEELAASQVDNLKVAILLTDGHGEYSDQAVAYAEQGWRIYTIGLSEGADEELLERIADEAHGQYYSVTTSENAEAVLQGIYVSLATELKGNTELLNRTYTMRTGDTVVETVHLDATATELTATVTWPGSECALRLVAPDGTEYPTENQNSYVYFAAGSTYSVLRIREPLPGDWSVQVDGIELDASGEPVSLQASMTTSTDPIVRIDSPSSGETLSGEVEIQVSADDVEGIRAVDIALDGVSLSTFSGPPYTTLLNTDLLDDGPHLLVATVRDVDGRYSIASTSVQVLNNPDLHQPALEVSGDLMTRVGWELPLSARASNIDDPYDGTYVWNFGDGTTRSGHRVSHVYATPGSFDVRVEFTSALGFSAEDRFKVDVAPAAAEEQETDTPVDVPSSGCSCQPPSFDELEMPDSASCSVASGPGRSPRSGSSSPAGGGTPIAAMWMLMMANLWRSRRKALDQVDADPRPGASDAE